MISVSRLSFSLEILMYFYYIGTPEKHKEQISSLFSFSSFLGDSNLFTLLHMNWPHSGKNWWKSAIKAITLKKIKLYISCTKCLIMEKHTRCAISTLLTGGTQRENLKILSLYWVHQCFWNLINCFIGGNSCTCYNYSLTS